jgi:hypothetical protein
VLEAVARPIPAFRSDLAEYSGRHLTIDEARIPIRQETLRRGAAHLLPPGSLQPGTA